MSTGSCFCGNIKISINGEPTAHALCHCLDCRKISGSTFSNNILIPSDNFKIVQGTPKEISKIADSGRKITNSFCPNCGTTLFRVGNWAPGAIILKAGVIDDPEWPSRNVPKGELFSDTRVAWVEPIKTAQQMIGMGES